MSVIRRTLFGLVLMLPILPASAQKPLPAAPPSLRAIDPQRIRKWDPLKAFTTDPEAPSGLLAYPAHIGENKTDYVDNFLAIRAIGPGKTPGSDTVFQYQSSSGGTLFYASISPDQRYIAFNYGEYSGYGSAYALQIWDRKNRTLLPGPPEVLRAWDHTWSPDSKKIAYIHGGDASGHPPSGLESVPESEHVRLCVFDLETRKRVVIVKGDAAVSMAWTPQGKLLYTAPSSDHRSLSIYETGANGGPPREIVSHGRTPIPSPDNRWIAFLGETLPASRASRHAPHLPVPSSGLYLYERRTGKRIRIRAGLSGVGAMWAPDSKRLVMIEETYRHLDKDRGQGTAHVKLVDIATLQRRPVALLTATDIQYLPQSHPEDEHQFRPVSVSPDGNWACFKVLEFAEQIQGSFIMHYSLQGVHLKTGKTLQLAQTACSSGSSLELDWRFTPNPVAPTHPIPVFRHPQDTGESANRTLLLSPNGRTLVTLERDGVKYWNTATGRRFFMRRWDSSHRIQPEQLPYRLPHYFWNDGNLYEYQSAHNTLTCVDLRTGAHIRSWPYKAPWARPDSQDVGFADDGSRLIRFGPTANSQAVVFDAVTSRRLGSLVPPPYSHEHPDDKVFSFSPDGLYAALLYGDRVIVWNIRTGRRVCVLADTRKYRYTRGLIRPLVFSPDGKSLVTGAENVVWAGPPEDGPNTEASHVHSTDLFVWDVRSGKRLRVVPDAGNVPAEADSASTFSSDGKWLLHQGRLWKLPAFQRAHSSDFETWLAVGGLTGVKSDEKGYSIWDLRANRRRWELPKGAANPQTDSNPPQAKRYLGAGTNLSIPNPRNRINALLLLQGAGSERRSSGCVSRTALR
ncbi:MAG: putative WD-repeat containing protein [Chthonomonadales bacterium]|nr:putative WD-repeat containing protein [Chthonomonadales bacterium]